MPSSSTGTGGMMGITREHLSIASDDTKMWVLELTGDIFAGLSPSILKQGAIAPLLIKDSKRFRPVTLLEPITKLVTGTVARRMSLLFHTHSLFHHHQFEFVHGGSCEAPIEVPDDMYDGAGHCRLHVRGPVARSDPEARSPTSLHCRLVRRGSASAAPSFWSAFFAHAHARARPHARTRTDDRRRTTRRAVRRRG